LSHPLPSKFKVIHFVHVFVIEQKL